MRRVLRGEAVVEPAQAFTIERSLPHGHVAAAEIGKRIGMTPSALVDRQRALIERFGLPTHGPKLDVDSVLEAMTLDKKVKDGAITWVLLEDAGKAVLRSDVPQDIVREVLTEVLL